MYRLGDGRHVAVLVEGLQKAADLYIDDRDAYVELFCVRGVKNRVKNRAQTKLVNRWTLVRETDTLLTSSRL